MTDVSPKERRAPRHAYGTGTVYRGRDRDVWWIAYWRGGKQYHESSHSTRKSDAVTLLAQRLGAVAEGRPTGREGAKLTLAQLREMLHEDYTARGRKSWRRAKEVFAALTAHFGETCRVGDLTSDRLHAYVQQRLTAPRGEGRPVGYAPATVQQEMAALKRSLNIAVERGLLPYHVKVPSMGTIQNARPEFVSDAEWLLIRMELPEWWQDLGDLAITMGWRALGELRPLTWAQVDWDAGTVRLEPGTTKNKDGRVWPLEAAPVVKAALQRRRAYTEDVEQRLGRPVASVFHVEGQPVTGAQFYKAWRGAAAKAGVRGADGRIKRPHDMRRSAVRALEVGGVARSIAKKLVGHKTDAMYARYSITTLKDLDDAVRRLHAPPAPAPEGAPA